MGVVSASAGLAMLAGAAWAGLVAPQHHVSQKGRSFQPAALTIQRRETVQIVNDDADLLHHAYVESDEFTFDSGNLASGAKADLTFPARGTFTVMCGIHPKMKLLVRVN